MITIVNGYVCTSSCDMAKARQNKDPHAPPGSPPGTTSKNDPASVFAGQPASILDGALKGLAGAAVAAAPVNGPQSIANLLV